MISAEDVIEMSRIETLHPGGLDLSKRIGELVHFTPATRVLDVSAGRGTFACFYAQKFGSRVTGIDINPQFVAIAKMRARREGVADRVDFRIGDSRALPFQESEFDIVVNECAVGLTAINDPQRVLGEMVRVTRSGGKIVIHENIWLKDLSRREREDASQRLGTIPYSVEEWEQMLMAAGAVPVAVEDWSGIENLWKMRPGHRWNPDNSSDLLTVPEKLGLIPRLILKHGIRATVELFRSRDKINRYLRDGYLGYALLVACRGS